MIQISYDNGPPGRRYALCVGIGTYTNLVNRNLRYAAADATTIAQRLADPQRGSFVVTVLTEPTQTTKASLEEAVEDLLSAPDRQAEDLVLLYFSCHGDVNPADHTFCLLPSNATQQANGLFEQTTLLGINDFARWFKSARAHNIVVLLDVCHSGGAGVALQRFKLDLSAGPNFFIIGAARLDQFTRQSSLLQHGLFTHCLLRAFEQPPTREGWLTISQIQNFVSEEIPWFAKDQPTQIQSWSVSVNPNLVLLRNPSYPELSPLPPLWNVPLQRNPFFTGQENLLSQLASILQNEQKTALTQPQAINGMGGIGKTQLALEYAYRHRQDYHAVLWGRADTREALISTFVNIAHLLDLPQRDGQDQMIAVGAVKSWLAGRSKWLFILDNADELAMVKEFIPQAFQGHLLLTTRAQAMGGLAHKLEMEVMHPEVGALLLLRRAGLIAPDVPLEQASSTDVRVAKALSEEMGGLPLALDQAGAYIEETQCDLSNYQLSYQKQRIQLLARRGGMASEHPEPVTTTWSLSFEKVEQADPIAAELLRFCTFLSPDAIPEEIIKKGAIHLGPRLELVSEDPLLLDEAIATLRRYSLLHRDVESHMLNVHRLVQAVLKAAMDEKEQQLWKQRAVRALAETFPSVEYANWQQCEHCLPHILMYVDFMVQEQKVHNEAARLLLKAGQYLHDHARFDEAQRLLQQAWHLTEQLYGAEDPSTAVVLNRLGLLYLDQGRYEQAESFLEYALAILKQKLGAEHPTTLAGLGGLALLYEKLGRYELVISLNQQILAIYEKQLGPQHLKIAPILTNLAPGYEMLGRYEQAELLYLRALAIREHALERDHPAIAESLNNLALCYMNQRKYEQARPLLERALENDEKIWGSQHPNVAADLHNLANLYREERKFAEAEPLLERALEIKEQQLGPDHPDTALGLDHLASLYAEEGKFAEAEPLLERAFTIFEQQLGLDHPYLARYLQDLLLIYTGKKKYEQAEQLLKRVLAITEKKWGPQHPNVAADLSNLASLYAKEGKFAEAESQLERALVILEFGLKPGHPRLAVSLQNLANLYQQQGKFAEAEPLLKRSLEVKEQQSGPNHPDTALSLDHLASLYQQQGKFAEAEPLLKRALEIKEQQLGPDHPDTALSLQTLGDLYRVQGKIAEAEPLLKRALEIKEQQLGPDHPDMAPSLSSLANLYRVQRKFAEAEPLLKRALILSEKHWGPDHPDIALRLNNLANLYWVQGKFTEAEPLFKRALSICEKWSGAKPSLGQIVQIVQGNYKTMLEKMNNNEDTIKHEAD